MQEDCALLLQGFKIQSYRQIDLDICVGLNIYLYLYKG